MKVSSADIDFLGHRLAAKWRKYLPPPKHAQNPRLAERAVQSAINTRGAVRLHGRWGNTLALLVLVRSNLARPHRPPRLPFEPQYDNLREYMQTHIARDEQRAVYYKRILRRMPPA